MEPTQTPQTQTNTADEQQPGQPLFADEPVAEQSAEIKNKEHVYRDQIQQFFRAPVVEGELPAQSVKLAPETPVRPPSVGEPLFAEPTTSAPDVTPTEHLFQKLVEDHIATGNMHPVEEAIDAHTEVPVQGDVEEQTSVAQKGTQESLPQEEPIVQKVESVAEPLSQTDEHIFTDLEEQVIPETQITPAEPLQEYEEIAHTEQEETNIVHQEEIESQEELTTEEEDTGENDTPFPSFSFGQQTGSTDVEDVLATPLQHEELSPELQESEESVSSENLLSPNTRQEETVEIQEPEIVQEVEEQQKQVPAPEDAVVSGNVVAQEVIPEETTSVMTQEDTSDDTTEILETSVVDTQNEESVPLEETDEETQLTKAEEIVTEEELERTTLLDDASTLETQLRLGGWEWLYEQFAAIDPQKALEKREYSSQELARAEAAFHTYVAEHRAQTVDFGDANEEFAAFTELFFINELLEQVEDPTTVTEQQALMTQQIQDDFFLLQDARPVRYILEYILGKYTAHSQVEYTPYIDYRVMAKRPLLVYMVLDLLISCLPTENPAFLLTVKDEIYQDRKKYVRFSFECAAHSKIQKSYQQVQPLFKNMLQLLRARFGMRVTDVSLEIVVDIPFVVKKGE